jgi:predicted amidohydrolase
LPASPAQHRIALVYSLPAVTAGGQWQITATVLDARGDELLSYAKVHLFGPEERKAFSPAEAAPAVVNLGGIKTSLAICYDVEFPEAVRAAAAAGADLLLVPTALAHGFEAVPQVLLRARALESQLTVAYANHSGTEEDGCTFLGGSVIAGPDGELLAAAGEPGRNCCTRRWPRRPARHGMKCPTCANGARSSTAPGESPERSRPAEPLRTGVRSRARHGTGPGPGPCPAIQRWH